MTNPFRNREGGGIHTAFPDTDPYLEHLKRRGKLVKTGMTVDELAVAMVRACGDCICEVCGKDYYSHPFADEARTDENRPFLHVTCNGDIVKL